MIGIFDSILKQQNLWRRASEDEGPLRFFFVFILFFLPLLALADGQISNANHFYREEPYVPQIKDYGFEVGTMSMKSGLYWLGVNLGINAGSCFHITDPNCQQYYDLGFGAGGRDGETQYIGTVSMRFQRIKFPSSWSPFTRIYAGVLNTIYPPIAEHYFTYGVGAGITRRLHEHLDLRLEGRAGYGYQAYFQGIVGLQLKIDDVIASFADKIKNLPKETIEGTGDVLKGIGEKLSPSKKDQKKDPQETKPRDH